ncbi:AraC family transcriptional regulator [Micromonospora sp. NBC_01655]|uniref:helix-turn-helix transcriptional regulator n=1 Tax=Micromonospora sp. NBC_01655 TaxID=2975983 RepID=UPI002251EC3C|nr:AraC family transcriptional regulator [Micromonospora sp. NBC_01655]MCX4471348.1 AraC family transcriptional regulator [Micromonospora sp. NBC_01655]
MAGSESPTTLRASSRLPGAEGFQPLLARTRTFHRPVGPATYDCVKLVTVRDGSALVYSEFGEKHAKAGDVLLRGANVLCGAQPEGHVTVTVIYLDLDFILDQFFWQYINLVKDRFASQSVADTIYTEPAKLLRLGEDRVGMLMPWLDELVALSVDGQYQQRFHRMQALWNAVIDQVSPFIQVSPTRILPNQRARTRPSIPRGRRFAPLRSEARTIRDLLHSDICHSWSIPELANAVHLSEKQLVRVFTDAYGKTPIAYLTMLRVEDMARILRESDASIAEAGRLVGWASRNRAASAFRECAGVTPGRYRAMQEKGDGYWYR